jgi:DNA-binding CsgD family transcriptional regulator
MVTAISSLREERTVAEIHRLGQAALEAPELLQRTARALHRVIPFDAYGATTIDPASKLITYAHAEQMGDGASGIRPVNPAWFQHFYFEEALDKTIDLARRGQWAASLEELTHGRLEQSLCYRESMRPAGIAYKAQAVFVDRNLWGDMEFYRQVGRAEFSASELALLRRIAPEVGAALKFAALRSAASPGDALDDATPGVLVVDQLGHVTGTPAAERLLQECEDFHPRWHDVRHLPVAVQVVLSALRWSLGTNQASVAPRLRVRGRSGRWLALHAAATEATDLRVGERVVVISPVAANELAWIGLSAYDLTAREEEVVKLVVEGLSTKQISDRLYIAEYTVQRHLSNIFEKVGVRSRRALIKHFFFEQLMPRAG